VVAFVAAVVAGCGGASTSNVQQQQSPSPNQLACTAGGPASSTWPQPSSRVDTTPPIVAARAAGDTLTLTFDRGTPEFELKPQSSARFTRTDGRGDAVDLAGSAGVLIVLRGFRGDMQNYSGATDLKPNAPTLVEVREIGDYEGVVGWAAGLNAPACASVTVGPSTLTFQFIRTR